eukprot:16367-Heterococcus_DN1.PRE.4
MDCNAIHTTTATHNTIQGLPLNSYTCFEGAIRTLTATTLPCPLPQPKAVIHLSHAVASQRCSTLARCISTSTKFCFIPVFITASSSLLRVIPVTPRVTLTATAMTIAAVVDVRAHSAKDTIVQ